MPLFRLLLVILPIVFVARVSAYTDVPELPDSPVTPLVEPLLKALNSGDGKQIAQFVTENFETGYLEEYPMAARIEEFLEINRIQGELSFHSTRIYPREMPANELAIVFKTEKTELWFGAIIKVTATKPHKIADLFLTPARIPTNAPKPEAVTVKQAIAELDDYIDLMVEMQVFSGTVLLAKMDTGSGSVMYSEQPNVLYSAARGLASKRFNVPNNMQTKFNLGSMNKMFTALGILQLVEAKKLSLTSKLSEFVDESWLSKHISEQIEIRHLLSHSSGLGNYFNQTYAKASKNNFRSLDDYKVLIDPNELRFEPGTRFGYSNTGIFMLGVVIETVTGEDYFDYIEKNIYDVAGMENSGSFEMDQPVPNLAIGYHRDRLQEFGWENNLYTHVLKGGPAGGGFSTAEDLLKYAVALTDHRIIGEELLKQALSDKPELSVNGYGFGFDVDVLPDDIIIGHGGGFMGISANLDIYRKQGFVAIVLSNYSRGTDSIKNKIRELISRID